MTIEIPARGQIGPGMQLKSRVLNLMCAGREVADDGGHSDAGPDRT